MFVGEGNGTPFQYSCLENPMDGGAWWAAVHGVAKSQIRLSDLTFTFHFHALEKEMATHSSVLAWRIPGTGEPGGLPSMGLHRVGHDWSNLAAAAAAPAKISSCVRWKSEKIFIRKTIMKTSKDLIVLSTLANGTVIDEKNEPEMNLNSSSGEPWFWIALKPCNRNKFPKLQKFPNKLKAL